MTEGKHHSAKHENGLLNRAAVKRLVRSARPGTHASHEYLNGLEAKIQQRLLDDIHRNGGKSTMRADLLIPIPSNPRKRR